MAKELAITQTDLNEEGIKTQLTQNDLLEVIVEEKTKAIDDEIDGANEKSKEFEDRVSRAKREFALRVFRKEAKRLKLPFTAEELEEKIEARVVCFDFGNVDRNDYFNPISILSLNVYNYNRGRKKEDKIHLQNGNSFSRMRDSVDINFRFTNRVEKKGYKEETSYSFSVAGVDAKKSEVHGIYKEIEAHNEKVKAIYAKYENVNLDKEAILKEIRTTFNKQLIIAGAPKLRQKVKDTFLIELQ